MGASGDAVIAIEEYAATYTGTAASLDAATYTAGGGWETPTLLQDDIGVVAQTSHRRVGNATLVWMKRAVGSVWASRVTSTAAAGAPPRGST